MESAVRIVEWIDDRGRSLFARWFEELDARGGKGRCRRLTRE